MGVHRTGGGSRPATQVACRLKPFTFRRASGFKATLASGEKLVVVGAKTATKFEADLVLIAPGAVDPGI